MSEKTNITENADMPKNTEISELTEVNFESIFSVGSIPSLNEVLENREKRVAFIKKLLLLYPDCSIISYKLNIAGPVKNNSFIARIFKIGLNHILNCINNEKLKITSSKAINLKTGPEYFAAISASPKDIKSKMIYIEENTKLGRLFDIDVLYMENGDVQHISREMIGYENRKCFVCQADARQCAGSRAHSLSSIRKSIWDIISSEVDIFQ